MGLQGCTLEHIVAVPVPRVRNESVMSSNADVSAIDSLGPGYESSKESHEMGVYDELQEVFGLLNGGMRVRRTSRTLRTALMACVLRWETCVVITERVTEFKRLRAWNSTGSTRGHWSPHRGQVTEATVAELWRRSTLAS